MRYGSPYWLEERVSLPGVVTPGPGPEVPKVDVGIAAANVRMDLGAVEFRVETPPDTGAPVFPKEVCAVFAPVDTDKSIDAATLMSSGWPQAGVEVTGPGTYHIPWGMVPYGDYDVALIPLLPD